ncbi:hypothetical protein KXJ69_12785 [Aureisphaera sp. CAU 1614]|uniref:Uncharacterized protein n=1 Tax=Halomarinibacterium sedimenti TaxID=2857106 RepID=A0A9X1FR17_9FLAO|nr:hypothetical protein [Halomarinibacterium sedimenti]MBW2938985.1 hypothetical protein [Halomarinibacterium sedimenti]
MQHKYTEIDALEKFYDTNNILILNITPSIFEGVFVITILLNDVSYKVFIQDEYRDLEIRNTLLHAVLVLREWEIIDDSTDYLDWCRQQGFPVKNEVLRQYYQETSANIPQITSYFKDNKLNSFITDLDFQLNARAAQFLRITTYN